MEEQKQYQSVFEFMMEYVLPDETNNIIDYSKISFEESMRYPLIVPSQSQYELNKNSSNDSEEDEKPKKEIKMVFRMDGTFDTDITETDEDKKNKLIQQKKKKVTRHGLTKEEKLFLRRERCRESAKIFRKRKNDIFNEKDQKIKEYEHIIAKLNDDITKLNDEKNCMEKKLYINDIMLRNYETMLEEKFK